MLIVYCQVRNYSNPYGFTHTHINLLTYRVCVLGTGKGLAGVSASSLSRDSIHVSAGRVGRFRLLD